MFTFVLDTAGKEDAPRRKTKTGRKREESEGWSEKRKEKRRWVCRVARGRERSLGNEEKKVRGKENVCVREEDIYIYITDRDGEGRKDRERERIPCLGKEPPVLAPACTVD